MNKYREKLRELKEKMLQLEKQAYGFRNKRDQLNLETRRLSNEIRALGEEISKYKQTLNELTSKRQEIFLELMKRKKEKDQLKEKLRELKREMRLYLSQINGIKRELKFKENMDINDLKSRIEKLEWEYQTSSLPIELEAKYVKSISELENKLKLMEMLRERENKIDEIKNRISQLNEKLEDIRNEMNTLYKQTIEFKEKINPIREKISSLKIMIREKIVQKASIKERADKYHQKYIEITTQIKSLKDEIDRLVFLAKAEQLAKIVEERNKIMKEKAEKIYERYLRGEKLSLEEFKILLKFNYKIK